MTKNVREFWNANTKLKNINLNNFEKLLRFKCQKYSSVRNFIVPFRNSLGFTSTFGSFLTSSPQITMRSLKISFLKTYWISKILKIKVYILHIIIYIFFWKYVFSLQISPIFEAWTNSIALCSWTFGVFHF